jgi:hypothetical protein
MHHHPVLRTFHRFVQGPSTREGTDRALADPADPPPCPSGPPLPSIHIARHVRFGCSGGSGPLVRESPKSPSHSLAVKPPDPKPPKPLSINCSPFSRAPSTSSLSPQRPSPVQGSLLPLSLAPRLFVWTFLRPGSGPSVAVKVGSVFLTFPLPIAVSHHLVSPPPQRCAC